MIVFFVVNFAVTICLYFLAKLYLSTVNSMIRLDSYASKVGLFFLWMAACGVVFLSVYLPVLAIRDSMLEIDPKVSIIPLVVSSIFIVYFQKKEIVKIGKAIDEKMNKKD